MFLLFLLPGIIIPGCNLFNNSMTGYFLDNTAAVEVTGIGERSAYAMRTDGTILIPPSGDAPRTVIEVILSNPRNFAVRQELLGVPEGKSIESRQAGTTGIEVIIEDAVARDQYNLSLAMRSSDGLRDFPAYPLRIKCLSFNEAEITEFFFRINGKYYGIKTDTPDAEANSGSISGDAITVTVPYKTDLTNLKPAVTYWGKSINPIEGTAWGSSTDSPHKYTVTPVNGTSQEYSVTVNIAPGITISITNEEFPALTFSGVPSNPVRAGELFTITATISNGTVTDWYIDISKAGSPTSTSATNTFTAPSIPGFYSVNVLVTVGGFLYSGSFGMTVE
jgi:hypothetical protein